jgi:hypothetical protein
MFADERQFLLPLPRQTFELAQWLTATAQKNYHVLVDENFYSVPFEFCGQRVDVRLTRKVVEILHSNIRIASHIRITGKRGGYSTHEEHMPQNHRAFIEWNGDKFRAEAALIGAHVAAVAECILTSYRVEQQAYRACMQLLKLADKHTPGILDAACAEAFKFTASPVLKTVQTVLGFDNFKSKPQNQQQTKNSFTRGSEYYGDGGME